MRAKKTFTGIRGVPSMKVRGGGDSELERARVAKRVKPQAGNWSMAPARAACDRRLGRASPLHMLVLLAKYRDSKTGNCFVRMNRLANELGVTRRMAQMHIAKLIKTGFLVVHPRRHDAGGYAANRYVLLYPPFGPPNSGDQQSDMDAADSVSIAKPSFA